MIRGALMTARPRRPLIFIVGATGTGKSELAISLAERYNGEIINGDALQLYEGLPITTNKIPEACRRGIPHHLLGCIGLHEQPWTVRQYHEQARLLASQCQEREKLPIVVGGSHHYLQSLLAPNALIDPENSIREEPTNPTLEQSILEASTADMLEKLRDLDPDQAKRWHPNDRRKIQRSLEICLQKGRPVSHVYLEQQSGRRSKRGCQDSNPNPSYIDDILVLWTHASSTQLNPRLDERIDAMMQQGLLHEVKALHKSRQDLASRGQQIDDSHGIWTAIGYKEFLPVFAQHGGDNLVANSVERTKISTKQYAKRQTRWIRLKLMSALDEVGSLAKLYLLDASEVSKWPQNVEVLAQDIVGRFLSGEHLPSPSSLSALASDLLESKQKQTRQARHCDSCDKTLMTEDEWTVHVQSKGHRAAIRPKVDWASIYPKVKK